MSELEIQQNLSGIWKIKDSVSNIRYSFWFERNQGHLTILELTEDNYEYLVLDDHPFVDIVKTKEGYNLKFTDLYENRTSRLHFLDSTKMILHDRGRNLEYLKVPN